MKTPIRIIAVTVALVFCLNMVIAIRNSAQKTKKVDLLRSEVADLRQYQEELKKELAYRKTSVFIEKEIQRISFDHLGLAEELKIKRESGKLVTPPDTYKRWLNLFGF